jgi:hypothetical protein
MAPEPVRVSANNTLKSLALPTGPSEVGEINDLTLGLGKDAVTEFQRVSAMAPKPLQQ